MDRDTGCAYKKDLLEKKGPLYKKKREREREKRKKNAHWLVVLYGLRQIRLAFDVHSIHITQYGNMNSRLAVRESGLCTQRPPRPPSL